MNLEKNSSSGEFSGSSRKFLIKTIVFFLFILFVVVVLDRLIWADIVDDILEGFLILAVAFFATSRKAFQQFFASLPRPHQVILPLFFALMVTGHLFDVPRRTFPFVSWVMYGRAAQSDEVAVYSYQGVTRDGETVIINPAHLFPSLAHGRIAMALEKRIDSLLKSKESGFENSISPRPEGLKGVIFDFRVWLAAAPAKDLKTQEKELAEFLMAIGKVYNRRFSGSPIESIAIIQTTIDIQNIVKNPEVKTVFHVALERKR